MNTLKYLLLLSTAALLFSPFAQAEDIEDIATVTLTSPLSGRTSVNFKDRANINTTVPAGSKADVMEVRQLRSGSYGVRVKVTALGKVLKESDKTPKVGDETWLYYSQKDPGLNFITKTGDEIDDPEESLVKRAQSDNSLGPVEGAVNKPSLPTQQKVLQNSKPIVESENDIIVPAPGEDPNLARNGALGATEGGYGFYCMNGQCPETVFNNRRDLSRVAKDASSETSYDYASSEKKAKPKMDTTPVPRSNDPNNKWANDPVVSKYSNSAAVKKMIGYGMSNRASRSHSMCYRGVKRALVAAGMVTSYPPGGQAKQGVRDLINQNASLSRQGKPTWINMLDNPKYRAMIKGPSDVPKGAVIIYKNGVSREAGDAAIKTDNGGRGGYVSDFYSPRPITLQPKGRRYQKLGIGYEIIGVMITQD